MAVASDDEQLNSRVNDPDDAALSRDGDDSSEEESESDDEEAGLNQDQPELLMPELLEIVLGKIEKGELDLTDPAQLQAFKAGDLNALATQVNDNLLPTALHIIASRDKKKGPKLDVKLKPLIRHLVKHPNNICKVTNRSAGQTSLLLAIQEKKERMVKWICGAHPNISSILKIPNASEGINCIHAAIDARLKSLGPLIEQADAAALIAKNNDGNTPLHLAVEYEKCTTGQLAIVEQIVAKSDRAIQESDRALLESGRVIRELSERGDFNRGGWSPFTHHKDTVNYARKKAEQAEKAEKAEREKAERAEKEAKKQTHTTEDRATDRQAGGHGRSDGSGSSTKGPGREPLAPNSRVMRPPTSPKMTATNPPSVAQKSRPLQIDPRTKYGGLAPQGPPQTPPVPVSSTPKPPQSTEPMDEALAAKKSSRQQKDGSKGSTGKASADSHKYVVDEETVKGVERFLKLHYLRSRSYSEALKILYGSDAAADLELFFDLRGDVNLKQSELENLLLFLRFEEILQYVAIPQLNVEADLVSANSKKPRAGAHATKQDGKGRRDLCAIFDQLRKKKKVNTIIKVIVDDLASPPHSDEAIEEALRGFNVEVWDWKRFDLCSEVILQSSAKVREVHLYWSGNNAVLRGWAEDGGLKKLEALRTVHLHTQQGLETTVRSRKNMKNFFDEMKKRCPHVKIFEHSMERGQTGDGAGIRAEEQAQNPPRNGWIQCMTDFRRLLYDAETTWGEPGKLHEKIKEKIMVAIIDDGVDYKSLPDYKFIGGRTFRTRDDRVHTLNDAHYYSGTGHGTIMAQQIHSILPWAEFFVLRLDDCPSEEGGRQLTTKSATQAILAAVQRKVHIISMSWTIDPPEDNEEGRLLEDALNQAAKANILMFCSASDKGAKTSQTYPSKAPAKMFTIGAATAAGTADSWVGNPLNLSFLLPGVEVPVEAEGNRSGQRPTSIKEATGSSVATALAAGLAALILYCVQVRRFRAGSDAEEKKADRDFKNLLKHDNMMQALKDIGTTDESNHKFIDVWQVFQKKVDQREHTEPEKLVDLIAEVGAMLCRKV